MTEVALAASHDRVNREPSASATGVEFALSQVTHWFAGDEGANVVIRDASLQVKAHEFVAIVGASGCGKTTILNMLAGLFAPAQGECEVLIGGNPISPGDRRVGYMTARDSLFPWRTLSANVALGLEIRGVHAKERRKIVSELIGRVGLAGRGGAYPKQLSHGMRQRANLARLLATAPTALLMDEPFGALDAQTKLTLQAEFLDIWERDRQTVVFVTHDLTEAALLADRIVVMAPQRIATEIAVPFERPRDVRELRFDREFAEFESYVWHTFEEISRDAMSSEVAE